MFCSFQWNVLFVNCCSVHCLVTSVKCLVELQKKSYIVCPIMSINMQLWCLVFRKSTQGRVSYVFYCHHFNFSKNFCDLPGKCVVPQVASRSYCQLPKGAVTLNWPLINNTIHTKEETSTHSIKTKQLDQHKYLAEQTDIKKNI